MSPTLYRRFLGPRPVNRHPPLDLSVAQLPIHAEGDVVFLAVGSTRVGYLGANQQKTLSLGLNTTFEAKLRPRSDSVPEEQWQKMLLGLTFSSLGWDFERARITKKTGSTTAPSDSHRDIRPAPRFDIGVDCRSG